VSNASSSHKYTFYFSVLDVITSHDARRYFFASLVSLDLTMRRVGATSRIQGRLCLPLPSPRNQVERRQVAAVLRLRHQASIPRIGAHGPERMVGRVDDESNNRQTPRRYRPQGEIAILKAQEDLCLGLLSTHNRAFSAPGLGRCLSA
jgi:hypothetical protein